MTLDDFFCLEWPDDSDGDVVWFEDKEPLSVSRDLELVRGSLLPDKPPVFQAVSGHIVLSVIRNNRVLPIVSKDIIDLMRSYNLTGWHTWPVRLFDIAGKPISDTYFGLGVTGRAGALDVEKSASSWSVRSGKKSPVNYRGLHFDLRSWDGSDVFLLQDRNHVLVSRRFVECMKPHPVVSWDFMPILSFGFY